MLKQMKNNLEEAARTLGSPLQAREFGTESTKNVGAFGEGQESAQGAGVAERNPSKSWWLNLWFPIVEQNPKIRYPVETAYFC